MHTDAVLALLRGLRASEDQLTSMICMAVGLQAPSFSVAPPYTNLRGVRGAGMETMTTAERFLVHRAAIADDCGAPRLTAAGRAWRRRSRVPFSKARGRRRRPLALPTR